jgi:hypothetical protein
VARLANFRSCSVYFGKKHMEKPLRELSVHELFEHMRELARSPILLERLKTLWAGTQLEELLDSCSDHEVATLLAFVQGSLGIFGPEFAVCEHAKKRLMRSSARPSNGNRRIVRDAGAELLNAEVALFRSGIPHMLLPFQRDRFASNTFLVPVLSEARASLLRAGFWSIPHLDATLLDSETQREIRLVEAERHS